MYHFAISLGEETETKRDPVLVASQMCERYFSSPLTYRHDNTNPTINPILRMKY